MCNRSLVCFAYLYIVVPCIHAASPARSIDNAAELTSPPPALEDSIKKLYAEADEFIENIFSPMVLPLPLINEFHQFSLAWQSIKEQSISHPTQTYPVIEKFIETVKKIYIKLELITLGKDKSTQAFLNQTVSKCDYQRTWLKILSFLGKHLDTFMHNPKETNIEVDTCLLNQVIYNHLPTQVQKELSYVFAGKDTKILATLLTSNVYEQLSPTFVSCYITSLLNYQKSQFSNNAYELTSAQDLIDDLIGTLLKEALKDNTQSPYTRMIQFFIAKLCDIKQHIIFIQQLQNIAKKNSTFVPIFMHHNRIINANAFSELYQTIQQTGRAILDSYCSLVADFFMHENHRNFPLFAYELQQIRIELCTLKNQYSGGVLKRWYHGTMPESSILEEMINLLDSIEKHVPYAQSETDLGAFIQKLFSGKNWFTQHALQYVSPLLLTQILKYLAPQLGPETTTKLLNFFGLNSANDSKDSNHLAIIDFANQNPELVKQLCEKNPEILTLLETELARNAQRHQ